MMSDSQLSQLANVFNPEMFLIQTRSIELPPQLTFEWKDVSKPFVHTHGGGVFFPDEEFLENIEEYKYNQFLKIGELSHSMSGSHCTLLFRNICQLCVPVQRDSGHY